MVVDYLAPEPLRLGANGAVVLHRLVGQYGICLDGVHLARLHGHVPPLPPAILGHVDGQKDVRPHDEKDDDGVEGIVLDEKQNAGDKDVEDHGEDLKDKVFKEGVHSGSTAEGAGDLADLLAEVEVEREAEHVLESGARETAEE